MSEEPKKRNLHLDPKVTITQIIAIIGLAITIASWNTGINSRLVKIEGETMRIEQTGVLQIKNIERILGRIERKQDKLFDKLDKKADK